MAEHGGGDEEVVRGVHEPWRNRWTSLVPRESCTLWPLHADYSIPCLIDCDVSFTSRSQPRDHDARFLFKGLHSFELDTGPGHPSSQLVADIRQEGPLAANVRLTVTATPVAQVSHFP